MSRALLYSIREYLRSPADDLESFFWVAVRSVLFNEKNVSPTEDEIVIKDCLLKNNKNRAMEQFDWIYEGDCSVILSASVPS